MEKKKDFVQRLFDLINEPRHSEAHNAQWPLEAHSIKPIPTISTIKPISTIPNINQIPMKKSELLREQIKNGQKELAELLEQEHKESRSQTVKELSEFTNEEKIEIFDSLYACAKSNLDSAEENGSESDDDEHYTWEAVMEIMGRNKQLFWEYYNSL